MNNFLKNYLSTILFLILGFTYFYNITFYQNFLIKDFYLKFIDFHINSLTIYKSIIIAYIILLIPFYKYYKDKSKARIVINHIIDKINDFTRKKRAKKIKSMFQFFVVLFLLYIFAWLKINFHDISSNKYIGTIILLVPIFLLYFFIKSIKYQIKIEEKISILAWVVKLFFAPLMIVWFTGQVFTMLNNMYLSYNDIPILSESFLLYFNKHFFWLFLSIILFVDLIFFTLGYLIEIPKLNNKIKSVDPSFFGWFVVLICYPPFNSYTSYILNWYAKEFPTFDNEYLHIGLNMLILILMGIYSWASYSLGLKASNLTNRGIIRKGPYKYIRHPAYITKNLVWRIGGLPLLIGNLYTYQYKHFFIVFFSLSARTFIYYLRAITEERHLSMDEEYIKYKKEVKYKFIPKIF